MKKCSIDFWGDCIPIPSINFRNLNTNCTKAFLALSAYKLFQRIKVYPQRHKSCTLLCFGPGVSKSELPVKGVIDLGLGTLYMIGALTYIIF